VAETGAGAVAPGAVWAADVSAARAGHYYKFVFNGGTWRSDPHSRLLNTADNNNSIILNPGAFDWFGDAFGVTNIRDLIIYEAHVGTFAGLSGTFQSFSNRLDYLRDLGVSVIELMPINEFPSATSWGYNPAYPYAIETSYGAPDTLKNMVRGCHQRDLAVFLDVVHNHWDSASALWQFDGWPPAPGYGGIYFYNTEPYANTPWGPRPDYGRAEVREFINNSFRMWLDEYRLDGFRWDAPKHIIYTTNDVFISNGLLMATNALAMMAANYPAVMNIAEDIKEINGFNAYWDFTFHYEVKDVLTQSSDAHRDMPTIARNINGTFGRIIYTESHDTTGDLNGGQRLPYAIYSAQADGYYARKRSTLGAALVMTAPGTPMILQGQEMLETNQFSDTRAVDWTRTNTWAGIVRLYRDLIRLRRNLDGVSEGLEGENVSTYHIDNVNKLIAYSRWAGGTTGREVVVVANFANATRVNYSLPFPAEGAWYVHFNSDATNYCADYFNTGSVVVAAAGIPAYGNVTIGPYSALILSRIPRSGMLIRESFLADAPVGDNDGVIDPGEIIRERIVLWNKSQLPATNVSARLSSASAAATVTVATATYAAMASEAAATNTAPFEYRIDASAACGTVLEFELAMTFNEQTLTSRLERLVGQPAAGPASANLYAGTNAPLPIAAYATPYSTLTIAEPGSNIVRDIDVLVRINHTYDRDLTLALQHPDGSEVLLVNRRGGSGDNFGSGACGAGTNTMFDQSAAEAITNAAVPFAGAYRPEGNLAQFNGKPLNGNWRLRMRDSYRNNTGTNLCWAIRATYEQQTYDCNCFSNRPPVAHSTNIVLTGYAGRHIVLPANDPDGQSLTFANTTLPVHGDLATIDAASNWETTYTPVYGFVGTDAFDFVACDGMVTSAPATVSIAVPAPADTDGDGMSDEYEMANFGGATNGAALADDDGDGMPNIEEYWANTLANDSNSCLRLTRPLPQFGGYAIGWMGVGGVRYRVEYNGGWETPFTAIVRALIAERCDEAPGEPAPMSFTDDFTLPPPPPNGLRLYRVRVVNE